MLTRFAYILIISNVPLYTYLIDTTSTLFYWLVNHSEHLNLLTFPMGVRVRVTSAAYQQPTYTPIDSIKMFPTCLKLNHKNKRHIF